MDRAAQIDTYLAEKLDDYLQEIIRLCRQPSISATKEGVDECARLTAEVLADHVERLQQ